MEHITINPNAPTALLDVVQEIILDHNNVRDLFARYIRATDINEKQAIVNTILREIAVHGETENNSVYQRMDEKNMKPLADHSREEHQEVEEALLKLGSMDVQNQPAHDKQLMEVMRLFQEHGDEEEMDILLKLQSQLTTEMSNQLALDFLNIREKLSQMPPPSSVQVGPTAQKLLALLMERQSLGFVDLRYQHPANSITGRSMKFEMPLLT
ncbi:hypothetical protein FRC19_005661 [Serendipita sp. 401]|nr:hypothetical protein FRC19_005661 [Serendipita sp. 401]KAG8861574.1 hypothetical protein FRC20_011456 [Serendipita sp. 405]